MSDNHPPKRQERAQEKYDVFVSFRGEDTRRGILSHLVRDLTRHSIEVFVDYRLKIGDEIEQSLVEAIERSFIYLIIFSPNYASSPWCLGELVKIVECKEKYGRSVFPIFYDVEPTHVRHQSSNSYKEAFAGHQIKYDNNKVQLWRRALNESAIIKGHQSSKFQDEAELVEKIVSDVNIKLKELAKCPVNSKGLVAIDEKIAAMLSLIGEEPNNSRVIGIWGMGGLGKTTLAQQVFNKLRNDYAASYFLADEKDQSDKTEIISLKKIIFSKLLGCHVEIDTPDFLPQDIVRKIGLLKVLIVLDNVNDPDHIQNLLGNLTDFGSGSIIIVTTRNEQVLKTNNAKRYQLTGLSSDEALQLFNLNAFNQSDHRMEYDELSKRVVCYAQGIPLVLKVLASHLRGNSKDEWESELDKLEKMPNQTVYDKLMWSYKDLDTKQQQIFLDLACFFVRSHRKINRGDLESLLKDSERDNSVVANLGRLKSKTLITISEDNFVFIHDSLQEMARKIVHDESIYDPGSRSRLWHPDDISQVLKTGKVTEAIRSIQIDLQTTQQFELISHIIPKMSRLQFLEIHENFKYDDFFQHHILAEGLRFLSTELKFLYWLSYPLKSLPENFSVEKLVILILRHSKMEKLWDGVKNLVNLKEVDLSWSAMLKELPDLSKATSLEKLDLGWCASLTTLSNHSQSRSLEYLCLTKCRNPLEFSVISENQTQLLHLDVSYCIELPLSLKTLNVRDCQSLQTLPKLPGSLNTLQASGCTSLQTLRDLPLSLTTLDVRGCHSLQTLPKLPGSLNTLQVSGCTSLQTLPDLSLSLTTLNVSHCPSLQTLPKLPGSLNTLQASCCTSLQTLPDLPLSLTTLDVNHCPSLVTLPKLPGSLNRLQASGCTSLQTLPDLPLFLTTLNVSHCPSLQTLPKLPGSLNRLQASGCTSLQTLPDLPLFLTTLNVSHCPSLQTLPKLPGSLNTLQASCCTSLQTLPDLPLSLTTLNFGGCHSLQTLPKLLRSLNTLQASGCTSLQTLPDLPLSLTTLNVQYCSSLQTLPKLPGSLNTLQASVCTSLQTLPDLPLSLTTLDVGGCHSLQTLPKLPGSLNTLHASGCTSLQTLPNLPLSLTTLDVRDCDSLQTLPKLPGSLNTLQASCCTSLQTLPDLHLSLTTLNVSHCPSLQTLPKLPGSLNTSKASCCTSLQTLPNLPLSLTTLHVSDCNSLQTLPKLPGSLNTLLITNCTSLQTLPDLPLSLENLNVKNCTALQTLQGHLPFLRFLNARECESLKTVLLFPSATVEQLKEKRRQVLFEDCLNLDEDSLVAIGLNARINVMKFANQCLSTPDRDFYSQIYGAVYVYPGSSVPEWFEYKTTKNHITIDQFSTPPSTQCGYIFCFIIGMYKDRNMCGRRIAVNLIISDSDGEGEKDSVTLCDWLCPSFVSDHVCVMHDQQCSDVLNRRTKNQTSFKIHVTIREAYYHRELREQALKGIGLSRISSSAYNSFIQQMELLHNH